MEHLLNDNKEGPIQYKNGYKLRDEMEHLVVNWMESQWKLRQQHDHNFPMDGKPLQSKY